jgi:hypothetical protein
MLKLVGAAILLLFISHSQTGVAGQNVSAKSAQVQDHPKKKPKKSDSKKANAKFNPTTFIKNKQRYDASTDASRPQAPTPTPVVIGNQTVICKPSVKSNEPCTGSECASKAPIQVDPIERPVAMIDNNEAITKEVMKTIRDNCAPPESEKAFVKPVFELGIKEPEKGTTDKREMIPKVGIQAAF